MAARNVERHVAYSRRLAMLNIALVEGFPCTTSNLCRSWPREVAALQALHPSRMKVKIAGSAVVKVVVAGGEWFAGVPLWTTEVLLLNSPQPLNRKSHTILHGSGCGVRIFVYVLPSIL